MSIRIATNSDASSIAAISIEVWLGTYLKQGVRAFFADYVLNEFTAAKTEKLIADPSQLILVSENIDGIDGFIRVHNASEAPVEGCSRSEISTFYVQPLHHRQGVGQQLLQSALDHVREIDVSSVWVAVNAANNAALAFYERQGFERVGDTHFRIEASDYLNYVYRYRLP